MTEWDVEREYIASLYYLGSELHKMEIHFVVCWDDEVYRTVSDSTFPQYQFIVLPQHVNDEYSSQGAILGVSHIVEFEEYEKCSITLDIPMTGAEVSGGWKITPMFHPTVGKSDY